MRPKNSGYFEDVKSCAMCLNPIETIDYQKRIHDLEEEVKQLRFALQQLKQKDSITKYYEKYFMFKSYEEMVHRIKYSIRHSKISKILPDDKPIKMMTLTFDPKMFKVLSNRESQRDYIEKVLITEYDMRKELVQGCYELHKNGVVHAHIIVDREHDLLRYFTKNQTNQYAVDCKEMPYSSAYTYITKETTKDADCATNYICNQKRLQTYTTLNANLF